jgi:aldehyde:ferredoxin oxidoreductase
VRGHLPHAVHNGGGLMYLVNGRAAVVDLSSGSVEEIEVGWGGSPSDSDALVAAGRLMASSGGELVFGSGLLTGSLVPSACAGFVGAGARSDGLGKIAPLVGSAGVELKLSGFDFIVVKGRSATPGYLWARDGMVEFVESSALVASDSWERTDAIRKEQGDRRIQVVSVGAWGTLSVPGAQFVNGYWGGEDRAGIGAEIGRLNLLAFAFRGMGDLEVAEPEEHFRSAVALQRKHLERLGESRGLLSYSDGRLPEDMSSLAHRHVACFGCRFPCRTFMKIFEDPAEMRSASPEPGYLVYDIDAAEELLSRGVTARDTVEILIHCARAGAEPLCIIRSIPDDGLLSVGSVDAVLASPSDVAPVVGADALGPGFQARADHLRCLGLGLCPRYWSKVGFDPGEVSECARSALGREL